MSTKYTAGPWKITKETTRGQFVTETKIRDKEDSVIAVLHCNIEGNAPLLTAAPDMLEELQSILSACEGDGWTLEELRACVSSRARDAIKLATGKE